MITERYKAGSAVANQKMLFKTLLFDKWYFWLQDIDGTIYLQPQGDDGVPDFTR